MAGGTGQSITTAVPQALGAAAMGTAAGMGYNPQQVQAGQLAATNLNPYLNPYTEQVIRANEADILRGAQMGMNQLGAQAQAARAFGGSRQAVTEAELGRNVAQQLAQSSAGLRQAGFTQAQQAAQQDIGTRMQAALANQQAGLGGAQFRLGAAQQLGNLANLGFGMGQQTQQNLALQGAIRQQQQQALIDAAREQFGGFVGAPQQAIATQLGAFGGSQTAAQTQTSTRKPGLFDYLSLGTGVAGSYLGR